MHLKLLSSCFLALSFLACGTDESSKLQNELSSDDLIFYSDDFIVTEVSYIEKATRTWLPGCMSYDVLQGTGWYPSVFRQELSLTPTEEASFTKIPKQGPLAKLCAAKTSDNSAIYIQSKKSPNLYGVVNFSMSDSEADLKSKSVCTVVADPSGIDYLECEALVLAQNSGSLVRIGFTN